MKNSKQIGLKFLTAVSALLFLTGAVGVSQPVHARRAKIHRQVRVRRPRRRAHGARRRTSKRRGKRTFRRRGGKRRSTHRSLVKRVRQRGIRMHVVTQRRSALTNPGYLKRVADHNDYPLVKNRRDVTRSATAISSYSNNYNHLTQEIRSKNGRVTFKTYCFLPVSNHRDQLYSPQAISVTPNGRYAYVAYNATNSNSGNPAVHVKANQVQIIKVDLSRLVKVGMNKDGQVVRNGRQVNHNGRYARIVKSGPIFTGGHGQAFNYNPRNHSLWLMNNNYGASSHPGIEEINSRTLQPSNRVNFHLNTVLGDNLAFDKYGNAINVDEAESHRTITKLHALKLFKGRVTPQSVRFQLIPGIEKAPATIIQSAAYNPRNDRLYIVGDGSILSVPANRLGRLSANDVRQTQFDSYREFEGLSFDQNGNGYLLSNRSPEIFRCNYSNF